RESEPDLLKQYELREYLTGLEIEHGSRLDGTSLAESRFGEEYGLNVLLLEREGRQRPAYGNTVLREGDTLLVQGKIADIAQIEEAEGLRIAGSTPSLAAGPDGSGGAEPSEGQALTLAEIMVPP